LVGFANGYTNNTVSIITGPIAKEINDEYHLNPKKKTAAILDIFSCIVQEFCLTDAGFVDFEFCQR
jgi:Na+/H+ antiporter NhaC